jgi:hypothetical protein
MYSIRRNAIIRNAPVKTTYHNTRGIDAVTNASRYSRDTIMASKKRSSSFCINSCVMNTNSAGSETRPPKSLKGHKEGFESGPLLVVISAHRLWVMLPAGGRKGHGPGQTAKRALFAGDQRD